MSTSHNASPSIDDTVDTETATFKMCGMKRQIAALQEELTAVTASKSQRKMYVIVILHFRFSEILMQRTVQL